MSLSFWQSVVVPHRKPRDGGHQISLYSPNARATVEGSGEEGLFLRRVLGPRDEGLGETIQLRVGVLGDTAARFFPLFDVWFNPHGMRAEELLHCGAPLQLRQLAVHSPNRPTCFDWWITRGARQLPLSLALQGGKGKLAIPADAFAGALQSLSLFGAGALKKIEKCGPLPSVTSLYFTGVGSVGESILAKFPMLKQLAVSGRNKDKKAPRGRTSGDKAAAQMDTVTLGGCKHLQSVWLSRCVVGGPPQPAGHLSRLETLHLDRCLLASPSALPPELPQLRRLHLDVLNPAFAVPLPRCPNLRAMTIDRPICSALGAMVQGCKPLRRLDVQHWDGKAFAFTGLSSIASRLEELHILHTPQLRGLDIAAYVGLCRLAITEASRLHRFELGQSCPVEQIFISGCDGVESLEWLAGASRLSVLEVEDCHALRHVDLSHNSCLKSVRLELCSELERVVGLGAVPQLHSLEVSACSALELLEFDRDSSIEDIYVTGCETLRSFDFLQFTPNLRVLRVGSCGSLEHLDLSRDVAVEKMRVWECDSLLSFAGLRHMPELRSLRATVCESLGSLDISCNTNLKELRLKECVELQSLDGLDRATGLRSLDIIACTSLAQLDLGEGSALETLYVCMCDELQAIQGLSSAWKLRALRVNWCDGLQHLSLRESEALQEIELESCYSLKTVASLAFYTQRGVATVSCCGDMEEVLSAKTTHERYEKEAIYKLAW